MTLSSPNYPKYYHADFVGCQWLLSAPEGSIIALEFNSFYISMDLHGYSVSLFDGICMETKELDTLNGLMPNDTKWTISSSGHHMFVSFDTAMVSHPGFNAKIHYGN